MCDRAQKWVQMHAGALLSHGEDIVHAGSARGAWAVVAAEPKTSLALGACLLLVAWLIKTLVSQLLGAPQDTRRRRRSKGGAADSRRASHQEDSIKSVRRRDRLTRWVTAAGERVGLRLPRGGGDGSGRGKAAASSAFKPRIRKRDRLYKAAKDIISRSRRIIEGPGRNAPKPFEAKAPPSHILDADHTPEGSMPPEMVIMARALRVFGHLSETVFELVPRMVPRVLAPHEALFNIGDTDDSLYIVVSGSVKLYSRIDASSKEDVLVSTLEPGETLTSLLSLVDILTGATSRYKTVMARAGDRGAKLFCLSADAFRAAGERDQTIMRQLVQVITVRLQRVTFLALYKFLGLTSELSQDIPDPATSQKQPQSAEQIHASAMSTAIMHHVAYPKQGERESDSEYFSRLEKAACADLADMFAVSSEETILKKNAYINSVEAGDIIFAQGQQENNDLLFVVDGVLETLLPSEDEEKFAHLFEVHPRGFAGELSVLSKMPSFVTVRSKTKAIVLRIPNAAMQELMDLYPSSVACLAQYLLRRVSPLVRRIDFALDWQHVEAGKPIYRQGSVAESAFIILNGRCRSVVRRDNGHKEILAEYGRHQIIGEIEVLTESQRTSTVYAVRDTELVKIPHGLLTLVRRRHPKVLTHLMRLLGQRLLTGGNESTSTSGVSTVALIAASNDVPLTKFTAELRRALAQIGPALHLNSANVAERKGLDPNHLRTNEEYQLISWLGGEEEDHQIVLYEADLEHTMWTRRCLRQADCILVVGLGANPPTLSPIENQLETLASRAQKELVLLHTLKTDSPKNTKQWLEMRSWCSRHHHVRCDDRILPEVRFNEIDDESSNDDGDDDDDGSEVFEEPAPEAALKFSDFGRLARRLTGTSVGLVLGGGGARGLAHLGIIRALEDHGIPIDMVGGTSIGSFVAALYAEEQGCRGTQLHARARQYCNRMLNYWAQVMDLTYPIVAMFTGRAFNGLIEDTFKDKLIEDLWLPYFCNSTDITSSQGRIHQHGSLWRYVRASMTLTGYLPPICDPADGHMLVDGGYVDVLPVDVMRSKMGANTIIAVDVAAKDAQDLTPFGDELSGWWLLWNRWNPFSTSVNIPDMGDISSRLAFIRSTLQLEEIKSRKDFEYVRAPIDGYQVMDWAKFDEIEQIGHDHVVPLIAEWLKRDTFGGANTGSTPGSPSRMYAQQRMRFQSVPELHALQNMQ